MRGRRELEKRYQKVVGRKGKTWGISSNTKNKGLLEGTTRSCWIILLTHVRIPVIPHKLGAVKYESSNPM